VAGLLFVAHPMHVASVASVCQRKDLVSGFLLFTTLIVYLCYRQSDRKFYYAVALLLFVMTLLSKATVMTIPLFILSLEWFAPPERKLPLWQRFLPIIPYVLAVALFIKVESIFLLQTGVLSQLYSSTVSPAIRLATALQALFYYLKLLLWPYPMLMLHDFSFARQAFSPMIMLAGIGNAMLIAVTWWLRRRAPLVSLGSILLLVTLLPVIGLVPSNTLIAERYLFLPLAGFSLMVAACWQALNDKGSVTRQAALYALIAVLLGYGALTIKRNYDWKDNLTLLLANARDLPGKSGVYYQIGAEYFARGEMGNALEYLRKAKALNAFYEIHYAVYSAIMAYQAGNLQQAGVVLDSMRHPFKLQVAEVNYLYGKIRQSAGDLTNAALYYRNAEKSTIPLGLIKPADIAAALTSLGSGNRPPRN
jgi:tetratricopeptide (TPR) repeat protein